MKRETFIEVAVSVVAVAVFVIVFVAVGASYTTKTGGSPILTGTGALALVGSIALFVVVMAIAGYWLADNNIEVEA